MNFILHYYIKGTCLLSIILYEVLLLIDLMCFMQVSWYSSSPLYLHIDIDMLSIVLQSGTLTKVYFFYQKTQEGTHRQC